MHTLNTTRDTCVPKLVLKSLYKKNDKLYNYLDSIKRCSVVQNANVSMGKIYIDLKGKGGHYRGDRTVCITFDGRMVVIRDYGGLVSSEYIKSEREFLNFMTTKIICKIKYINL